MLLKRSLGKGKKIKMSLCTMKEKDYLNCISFENSLQCKKEKKKKRKKLQTFTCNFLSVTSFKLVCSVQKKVRFIYIKEIENNYSQLMSNF